MAPSLENRQVPAVPLHHDHHQASSLTPHDDRTEYGQSAGLAPLNAPNALNDSDETEEGEDHPTAPALSGLRASVGPQFSNPQLLADVRADVGRMMAMEDQIAGLEDDVEDLQKKLDDERDAREEEKARLEQQNETLLMTLESERVERRIERDAEKSEKARLEKERDEAREALARRKESLPSVFFSSDSFPSRSRHLTLPNPLTILPRSLLFRLQDLAQSTRSTPTHANCSLLDLAAAATPAQVRAANARAALKRKREAAAATVNDEEGEDPAAGTQGCKKRTKRAVNETAAKGRSKRGEEPPHKGLSEGRKTRK
ncbi:MAG: hypothetical protein Q9187_000089 [Circinaria calcarea]